MIDKNGLIFYIDKYTKSIEGKYNFVGYLIAAITVTLSLCTANFQDFINLEGYVWKAIFIIIDFILICISIKTAYHSWKSRGIDPESLVLKLISLDKNNNIHIKVDNY